MLGDTLTLELLLQPEPPVVAVLGAPAAATTAAAPAGAGAGGRVVSLATYCPAAEPPHQVVRLPHPHPSQPTAAIRLRAGVPPCVLVPEPPEVAHWDGSRWSADGVFDVAFNAATRCLAFRTLHTGSHALVQPVSAEWPYSSWSLTPATAPATRARRPPRRPRGHPPPPPPPPPVVASAAVLELVTRRFTVRIAIDGGACCLLAPRLPELRHLLPPPPPPPAAAPPPRGRPQPQPRQPSPRLGEPEVGGQLAGHAVGEDGEDEGEGEGVWLPPGQLLAALSAAGLHLLPEDADRAPLNAAREREYQRAAALRQSGSAATAADATAADASTTLHRHQRLRAPSTSGSSGLPPPGEAGRPTDGDVTPGLRSPPAAAAAAAATTRSTQQPQPQLQQQLFPPRRGSEVTVGSLASVDDAATPDGGAPQPAGSGDGSGGGSGDGGGGGPPFALVISGVTRPLPLAGKEPALEDAAYVQLAQCAGGGAQWASSKWSAVPGCPSSVVVVRAREAPDRSVSESVVGAVPPASAAWRVLELRVDAGAAAGVRAAVVADSEQDAEREWAAAVTTTEGAVTRTPPLAGAVHDGSASGMVGVESGPSPPAAGAASAGGGGVQQAVAAAGNGGSAAMLRAGGSSDEATPPVGGGGDPATSAAALAGGCVASEASESTAAAVAVSGGLLPPAPAPSLYRGLCAPGTTSHATLRLALAPRVSPAAAASMASADPAFATCVLRLLRLTRPLAFGQ